MNFLNTVLIELHSTPNTQQNISSLVVICDAKNRFYRKKGIGNVVSVWNVSVIGLSLYAEQKVDFIQEMFD